IRVANNSWGSSFRLFDPDEPINQATKAAHDAGITVVFAAGNEATEMAINPYSVAPWVISVGAGTLNHERASFSSGGIEFDDSTRVQPSWQSGYGYLDAKAAVDLGGRHRYTQKALARLQQAADARVLSDRDYKVLSTDYWTFPAAPVTVNGVPDTRTYSLDVTSATQAIKALVSYPSPSYVGVNPFDYHLTPVHAAGHT